MSRGAAASRMEFDEVIELGSSSNRANWELGQSANEQYSAELPKSFADVKKMLSSEQPQTIPTNHSSTSNGLQAGYARKGKLSAFETALNNIAGLVANITEAYSAVVFVADPQSKVLHLAGAHTLSRDLIWDAQVAYGCGLVGWVAENGVRISVSPFEHDASTLRYYTKDQSLKSFIAVPITNSRGKFLGVICCDSKKSYAFAKIAEKLMMDCASQAATTIELFKELGQSQQKANPQRDEMQSLLDSLREHEDEKALLSRAADLPMTLVERDALVVVAIAEGGLGEGSFYTTQSQDRIGHRLFELVCKHKKVICGERSVHALPTDDIKQRSFLSVPFHVLGKEAGSFNLLSKPYEAFQAQQIELLERVAKVVGHELERIRLKDRLNSGVETTGILSWKNFAKQVASEFQGAKQRRTPLALIRVAVKNLEEIEDIAGVEIAVELMQRVMRLVDQVKRQGSLATYLYGSQLLILTEASEVATTASRLSSLIERLGSPEQLGSANASSRLGRLLKDGLVISHAEFPREADSLSGLVARTLRYPERTLREIKA